MLAGRGYKKMLRHGIVPGDEPWFPAVDWHSTSVVSKTLTEVRIIAISAEKRNQGALHRMGDSIVACGLCPVIVGPISPHMLGILRHWGWHRRLSKSANLRACPRASHPDRTLTEAAGLIKNSYSTAVKGVQDYNNKFIRLPSWSKRLSRPPRRFCTLDFAFLDVDVTNR